MTQKVSLERSYLALIEFLMLSKQRVLELGGKHHLSGMQTITLLLLEEPRPMGSFKQLFNCDASNVTGIIDGLEQKQLVKRFEVQTDRRIKMVKLLSKGERVRSELLLKLTNDDQYLLTHLTPDEVASFIGLVQKITGHTKLTMKGSK